MLELEKIKEELDDLRKKMVNLICQVNQIEEKQEEDLTKLCTIDEKIILKNLNNNKPLVDWWIARDRSGLYIYESEPIFSTERIAFYEENNNYHGFNMYRNLFQFIKNNGCYRVADLIADLEEEIELWN